MITSPPVKPLLPLSCSVRNPFMVTVYPPAPDSVIGPSAMSPPMALAAPKPLTFGENVALPVIVTVGKLAT